MSGSDLPMALTRARDRLYVLGGKGRASDDDPPRTFLRQLRAAAGQVSSSNATALLRRELAVGMLNGVVFSVVIAVIAMIWYEDVPLGLVMAAAILVEATLRFLGLGLVVDPSWGEMVNQAVQSSSFNWWMETIAEGDRQSLTRQCHRF